LLDKNGRQDACSTLEFHDTFYRFVIVELFVKSAPSGII